MHIPKRANILPGRGYFLGASSSPTYVLVLSASDDSVTYVAIGDMTRSVATRWIAEDLIARGGATMARAGRAELHGAPSSPSDYDRLRVLVSPAEGVSGDLWRAAEQYGGVGGIDDMYEITMRRAQLDALQADVRFSVQSIDVIALCPTA